jgi:flagellar protein FliO/FliZ
MISICLTPLKTYAYARSYLQPLEDNTLAYSFFKLMYSIVIFALILVIAYFVTKFIAKKGTFGNNNKNLKMIEALPLGMDKCVYLVKAGEQYLLLAGTKNNLTLVSTIESNMLSLGEIPEAHTKNITENFENIINRYKRTEKESDTNYISRAHIASDDDYMASTKMKLNNLKSMVRGNKLDE